MALRFHLDEHVHPGIGHGLRQRGIDVTTSVEARLLGATDATQFAHACLQGRVFVTHDRDFLAISPARTDHPGMVYCHQQTRSIGRMVKSLANLSALHAADPMRGRVVFL